MKFLTETFNRLFKTSPSYFQVIQKISLVVAFLSGLPLLVQQFQSQLNIVLPPWVVDMSNKAFLIGSIVTWIIAKLPVAHVQDSQMPFTVKKDSF